MDLAQAHLQALELMEREGSVAAAFNLGNGEGFSVRQVVDTVEAVTGRQPPTRPAPRRAGDPASLVASAELAADRLGWRPRFPSLDSIVRSAWEWHRQHPAGYDDRAG